MTLQNSSRGLFGLALLALFGCREQATVTPEPTKSEAAPSESTPESTAEQSCARMLERFGDEVAQAEAEACVAALTTGTELEVCKEAGRDADYLECFDSCMGSVGIEAADYDPGDSSTSPVVNCVVGCFSTTCA
jgi:hypothetical protein